MKLSRYSGMRLHLVRHGRSAHVHRGWLAHHELPSWRDAYDAAGLIEGERPPDALRALAAEAGLVVSSDLPRAIESAALIRPGSQCERSPLLRETPLAIPELGAVKLPLAVWGTLIGLNWMLDRTKGVGDARDRAAESAHWLSTLAADHRSVVVVTHGAFRYYLAEALVKAGWSPRGKRSFDHWSAWEVVR